MTITAIQYFTKPRALQHQLNAEDLLSRVNELLAEWEQAKGKPIPIDTDTGSSISGVERGDGDGGYRTPGSLTGAPSSSHREGKGVDVFDPHDEIDGWLDTFEDSTGANLKLARYGLYREHPSATAKWCHLTTRAPRSGRRTFYP